MLWSDVLSSVPELHWSCQMVHYVHYNMRQAKLSELIDYLDTYSIVHSYTGLCHTVETDFCFISKWFYYCVFTSYFCVYFVFQELLWQPQLPSSECCRLWKNDEKCFSKYESTSTWHEGKIKISFSEMNFTGMNCKSLALSLVTEHLLLQFISCSLNIDVKWNKVPLYFGSSSIRRAPQGTQCDHDLCF